METLIRKAASRLRNSKHSVAFTGAGISVESGIPPFRGSGGLWEKYNPIVLDIGYFHSNPLEAWKIIRELFYDFFGKARPNKAHEVLANWEQSGYLNAVITQNIDNLHQEAGSKTVIEFHGTAQSMVCLSCNSRYLAKEIDLMNLPPRCPECKGLLKPDFVFFGENIPFQANLNAFEQAKRSEVFIVVGTTGEVMPASMLPFTAKENGALIIEINPEKSLITNQLTDIHLKGKAGEIFTELDTELKKLTK